MNARAPLVIFDCDGTLVDSERLQLELFAELAAGHGIEIDVDAEAPRFLGARFADCVADVERRAGRSLPENFIGDFRAAAAEMFRHRLQPMPYAHETLAGLGRARCVASNGPREKTELSLAITGLDRYVGEAVYSAYDVGSWKPDPALFLSAAADMGFAPTDCVVVEDSDHGINAGIAAGMQVVALGRPAFAHPGVHHIDALRDLLPLIETLAATAIDAVPGPGRYTGR